MRMMEFREKSIDIDEDGNVRSTVPELELRARASVSWVSTADQVTLFSPQFQFEPYHTKFSSSIGIMNMKAIKASLAVLSGLLGAFAAQEQLINVSNFGANPTAITMSVYKPAKLASPLPLIVALHECTASGQIYFESTQYANLADEYGFIVIYPTSPAGSGG